MLRIGMVWSCLLAVTAFAQESGAAVESTTKQLATPGGGSISYTISATPAMARNLRPIVIILKADGALGNIGASSLSHALGKVGWVAITIDATTQPLGAPHPLHELCRRLRVTYRIEGVRFYWVSIGDVAVPPSLTPEFVVPKPLPVAHDETPPAVDALRKLRESTRRSDPAEQSAAEALDDFCDAASRGDAKRYFALFAPDGVFFGTDGAERWTVDAFRKFCEPYFKRESAWIFIPTSRNFVLSEDGTHCYFDEALYSASYGRCRGTGALRRIDGNWKIAQYNLSIPIPNDLAPDFVARIRATERGESRPSGATTLYIVRHAEKSTKDSKDQDPPLSDVGIARSLSLYQALRSVGVSFVFTSDKKRTQQTAEYFRVAGAKATSLPAADVKAIVTAATAHPGEATLIVSHSNVIPGILKELGITEKVEIPETAYDDLFVVTIDAAGQSRMQHLHYGQMSVAK